MTLSVIIITKNEEEMLEDCLKSLSGLSSEILIIDDESYDGTLKIAQKYQTNIFIHKKINFADQRNFGLSKAKGDWILYIDADERLTPELAKEIKSIINTECTNAQIRQQNFVYYYLHRQNFYLNRPWSYQEKVQKLFKKDKLKGWYGEIHETPIIKGEYGILNHPLLHYSHRNIASMLQKTIEWSKIEAKLRFDVKHPKVVWWRFLRVMIGEFWHYYIREKGYKVGTVGLIESLYQSFSIFITYARLYELQQNSKD